MTTFTREDYEMAAKAAGYAVIGDLHPQDGVNVIIGGRVYLWRPPEDDGDALRLAVKLRIRFELHTRWAYVAAFVNDVTGRFEEATDADECAATRRAIFRAAIAIGKAMP